MGGQSQLQCVLSASHHRPQRIPINSIRRLESLFRRPIVLGQIANIPIRHNRVIHVVTEDPLPGHQIERVAQTHLSERVRDIRVIALLPKEHVKDLVVVGRQIRQQVVTIVVGKVLHEVGYLPVVLEIVLEAHEGQHLQLFQSAETQIQG